MVQSRPGGVGVVPQEKAHCKNEPVLRSFSHSLEQSEDKEHSQRPLSLASHLAAGTEVLKLDYSVQLHCSLQPIHQIVEGQVPFVALPIQNFSYPKQDTMITSAKTVRSNNKQHTLDSVVRLELVLDPSVLFIQPGLDFLRSSALVLRKHVGIHEVL